MKKLILLSALLIFGFVSAQTVSKQVISPLGGNEHNNSHKLSYTVGEIIVGAMTNEEGSIQLGNGYYPSLNLEALELTFNHWKDNGYCNEAHLLNKKVGIDYYKPF